jgi:hypothetical protein
LLQFNLSLAGVDAETTTIRAETIIDLQLPSSSRNKGFYAECEHAFQVLCDYFEASSFIPTLQAEAYAIQAHYKRLSSEAPHNEITSTDTIAGLSGPLATQVHNVQSGYDLLRITLMLAKRKAAQRRLVYFDMHLYRGDGGVTIVALPATIQISDDALHEES